MKPLRTLLLAFTCISFTSCVQINELIEIMSNGSGQFSTTTDLKGLVDMMEAMGGEEFEKMKMDKVDTSMMLTDAISGSGDFSSSEKELMSNAKLFVKMNLEPKEYYFRMMYPFSSLASLQELTALKGKVDIGGYVRKTMKQENQEGDPLSRVLSVFDYQVENGLIKKTVNREKLKQIMEDPKMAELQEGADMGIEIQYNITYKLPSIVKKTGNKQAVISSDKKSVTLNSNLLDIFSKPEEFEISIEY
jgi:hypothetical protein